MDARRSEHGVMDILRANAEDDLFACIGLVDARAVLRDLQQEIAGIDAQVAAILAQGSGEEVHRR
jgi:hypothetical protein